MGACVFIFQTPLLGCGVAGLDGERDARGETPLVRASLAEFAARDSFGAGVFSLLSPLDPVSSSSASSSSRGATVWRVGPSS